MERRGLENKVIPAAPETVRQVIVSRFSCDECGVPLMQHNAGAWAEEGQEPRGRIRIYLDRETFGQQAAGSQSIVRDYCDEHLALTWRSLTEITAYGHPEERDAWDALRRLEEGSFTERFEND